MSKADKMLKELGYVQVVETHDETIYVRDSSPNITLHHKLKGVFIGLSFISLDKFSAINEKINELGWLNDG